MRRVLTLAVAASCGRLGFDAPRIADSAADTFVADAAVPALTSTTGSTTGDTGTPPLTLVVPITKSTAGHMLIVGITDHQGNAVASIIDGDGAPLTSTHAQAVNGSTSTEIWYESNAAAVDRVTVTMVTGSYFDVFVGEFAGVSGPPAAVAMKCLEYPPALVEAPVTTTVANELVFTSTMFAYPIYVSQMQPPFTGFPPQTGNDAGYLIAASPGTYGSSFDIDSGSGMSAMTCASSAAWLSE